MKAQMPMWLRAMRRAPYRTAIMAAVAFSLPHYVDAREVAMQRSIATAAGATYWDSHDANGWWIGFGMMKMMRGARPFIALTVAVDTTNYNIRTQAIAAPAWIGGVAVDVVLTINTSIWVGLAFVGAANGAIDTGTGWTSGTNINIVINGSLAACGGTGGASNGGAGSAGGDALYLQWPVSIDNGAGFIAGGGGGGGGGSQLSDGTAFANGGGGGGGQGNPGGSGGPDSSGGSGPTAGTRTSFGLGGPGGVDGFFHLQAGSGGFGGAWAQPGATGGPPDSGSSSPGAGGAAGRAIVTNGNAITWIAGNNVTQVKGAIV
jgi:hypothetical protein